MNSPLVRFLRAVFSAVRTGWLMLGLTLLLLVGLELTMRVRRYREERPASGPPTYTEGDYRREPWAEQYRKEMLEIGNMRWRSYVYFRHAPYRGTYINIDSLGRRVTPQPATPAVPALRVRLYGGSTMWGEPLRDDHTIAAEIARRLQGLVPPGQRIEVTNVGESGYVFTQDVLQLVLDLRGGERPDVVLFYDGLNDVAGTIEDREAGLPLNEHHRATEFALGRALDRRLYPVGLERELGPALELGRQAFERLAFVEWVRSKKRGPPPPMLRPDSVAAWTVRSYANTVRSVEALAAAYGFTPVYVWQPNLHATEKQLDPYEKRLRAQIEKDSLHHTAQGAHRLIPALLDSAMRGVAAGRFVNETKLFAGDPQPVYVDRVGHNTEGAVPTIVDGFWPALEAAVKGQLKASAAGATAAAKPRR